MKLKRCKVTGFPMSAVEAKASYCETRHCLVDCPITHLFK